MKNNKSSTRQIAKITLSLAFAFSMLHVTSFGKDGRTEEEETKKKAVLIISAIKHSKWQNYAKPDLFMIGIIGDSELCQYLKKFYSGQLKEGRKVVFADYSNVMDVDAKCQAIYLGESKSHLLDELKTSQQKPLIITSSEGLAKRGSGINLIYRNGKLVFEVNKKVVQQANVQISSEFLLLAIPVQ